jgi:hypothetical protein
MNKASKIIQLISFLLFLSISSWAQTQDLSAKKQTYFLDEVCPTNSVMDVTDPRALLQNPTSPVSKFYKNLQAKTYEYLHVNAFQAEMLVSCVDALQHKPTQFFSKIHLDQKIVPEFCHNSLDPLNLQMMEGWRMMRVALALGNPRFRGNVFTDGPLVKMDPEVKHPFYGVTKLIPLSSIEEKIALSLFDAEIGILQQEFQSQHQKVKWSSSSKFLSQQSLNEMYRSQEEMYVQARVERIRQKYQKIYFEMLRKAPILIYIENPQPSYQELRAAFFKVQKNSEKVLQRLKDNSEKYPDAFLIYSNIVQDVLKNHPDQCPAAKAWYRQHEEEELLSLSGRIGLSVITGFAASFGRQLFIRVVGGVAGVATNSTYLIGTYHDYNDSSVKAFSTVVNQLGVGDFEKLSKDEQTMLMSSVLLPSKIHAANLEAIEFFAAAKHTLGVVLAH